MSNAAAEAEAKASYDQYVAGEEALEERAVNYYASVSQNYGSGFFDTTLHQFHEQVDISHVAFHSSPGNVDCIDDPSLTPHDHPLRAIAWVLNHCSSNAVDMSSSKIRFFCYSLTDPVAIELLVHAGLKSTVQIILENDERGKNIEALKEFFKSYGANMFYENTEVRIAPQSLSSSRGSMHDKALITDSHAMYGSYNMSKMARAGNWESIVVVQPPPESSIQAFDTLWVQLADSLFENIFPETNIPMGKKRKARNSLRAVEQEKKQRAT